MAARARYWKNAWWIFVNYRKVRKAFRLGACDKKTAHAAAGQISAKLALGDTSVLDPKSAPAEAGVPTFGEIAREWLDSYPTLRGIRPNTAINYRSFTTAHLLPAFGEQPITAVTASAIEAFIADTSARGSVRHQGKGLSDASLRAGLVALQLILRRAVRLGHLAANPMLNVERRRVERIEHVDPFSPRELQAIFQAAGTLDADFATMLRVWTQSGMRAGEVAGLQGQDIDLEHGRALVRRTLSRGRSGPTKTGRERQVSFLHPIAADTPEWRPGVGDTRVALAGIRKLRVQAIEPTALLFTRRGVAWDSKALNREWRRVLAKAGVRYRMPEQLRHTFASTMLSRNAPLLYVQRCGGWRSANVLLSVYARWMPQDGDQGRAAGAGDAIAGPAMMEPARDRAVVGFEPGGGVHGA